MLSDIHPGSHIFVTTGGKLARSKQSALAEPEYLNGERCVLVFSSSGLWTQFNSVIGATCSMTEFQVLEELKEEEIFEMGSVKFDSLLFVKQTHVEDLSIDMWFKLMESPSFGQINLSKYLPGPTSNCDVASINKKKMVTKENVDPGPEEDKENRQPRAGRFKLEFVGKDPRTFIEENTAKNTKKGNLKVKNLFKLFMTEVHPEKEGTIETLPIEELPKLLTECFMMLQKEDGEEYNASTLESYYQSIARVLLDSRKMNIKLDPNFSELRKVIDKKQKLSCESGQIPGKNKSRSIPAQVLAECWAQGAFGTDSPRALVATVILHVQGSFGSRGKTELWNMSNSDIVQGPDRLKLIQLGQGGVWQISVYVRDKIIGISINNNYKQKCTQRSKPLNNSYSFNMTVSRGDGLPQFLSLSERITKTRRGLKGQGNSSVDFLVHILTLYYQHPTISCVFQVHVKSILGCIQMTRDRRGAGFAPS